MEGRGGEDQILGLRSVFSVLLPNHLSGVEVSPLVQLPSFLSLEEAFPGWGRSAGLCHWGLRSPAVPANLAGP